MKKAICFLMAVTACFSLAGCGDTTGSRSANQGKSVNEVLSAGMLGDDGAAAQDAAPAAPAGAVSSGELPDEYKKIDVDLTSLSSTMVYSEVYNMTDSPDGYIGKTVKMAGEFNVYEGDGRNYYACLIADATACCSQGIEFILKDARSYPDEYPPAGDTITVVGTFDTYYEGDMRYCQLVDAYIM